MRINLSNCTQEEFNAHVKKILEIHKANENPNSPKQDSKQTIKRQHRQQLQQNGTGTQLERLLRIIGITEKEGCKCGQRAAVMNSEGPDWCEKNIKTIVGWMKEEAQKRKLKFLFNEKLAALLVKRAIKNARKKLKTLETQKEQEV